LHNAIETGGPLLEPSRLLLNAALLIGDGEQALIAWRWYYAEKPSGIADVDARLASALASWKSGTAPSIESRRDVALALARSRLFPEADLALRDPCRGAAIDDAATHDLILYAAALRRINAITAESYRSVAAHTKGPNLKREVLAEGEALWKALSWPNGVPKFSSEALLKELGTRFGAVATLGETDDIPTLLLGHSVIDETREVEQYGRKASLHFMQLDGMVSSGYSAWLTYGDVGTGGWSGSGGDIVQIRTMYADDAVESWRRMTDPVERSERDRRVASESKRDEERIRANAIAPLPGLQMRLGRQGLEKIRDELSASGLAGDALRDAFIARARRDKFESSIWAHEGRHAIDKTQFGIKDSTELEFRAKLSEIVFARSPRLMGSILDPIGGSSAHGRANERIMKGVVESMRAHASEIAGFDKSAPVLPQLDRLTDDQIRAAFRSLDPLAK
jgi:hypothetical protein